MSRRRWEQSFNDFDNCCGGRHHHHHHGLFGLIPMLVNLIVGVVTFGLTVAFRVVGAVFSSFFGTLSDMDRNSRNEGYNNQQQTSYSQQSEARQQSEHSQHSEARPQTASADKSESPKEQKAAPKATEAKNQQGRGDWNILIFVLTLIPAVLTLAMGKLIYTGIIVAAGVVLMIIYSSIRKINMGLKARKAEKAAAEEFVETDDNEIIEKLIKEAFDKVYDIRKDLPKVANPEIKNSIEALCDKAEKIIGEVRTNPECLSVVKKFFYYYLDAFSEIFRKYLRISSFGDSSEEIEKVVEETERSFKDIDNLFRELCEKMLEKDMLNLKAEINVMKNSNA